MSSDSRDDGGAGVGYAAAAHVCPHASALVVKGADDLKELELSTFILSLVRLICMLKPNSRFSDCQMS